MPAPYQPGEFVWSRFEGSWYEAEIEEVEPEGTYRVYYHEYDDSVPGQPLYLIKDYVEGETEPPPDGPNQKGADMTAEEEFAEEEEGEFEEEEEEPAKPEPSSMEERLELKKKEAAVREKERKAADAKAKADARAPTKPVDTKLYDSAKIAERRMSAKRDELEKAHSFQPKLATRKPSIGGDTKPKPAGSRTSALYEHGKTKGVKSSASFSAYSESSQPAELTYAPKINKASSSGDSSSGSDRINRLYQAGKEREMARLQKQDSERELERPKTFDERMGFKPGKNSGLQKDLVTTGARTNALYQEAQMRAAKKAQQKKLDEEKAAGATFQPKLLTKKSSRSSMGSSSNLGGGNAHSRLYQKGAEQLEKAAKKRDEVWNEQDTFTPDISASQKYCEAESLPGARHAALFMQGEILRQKRDEMADYLVDGKEIDELTFTPAVNYTYNDELLGGDERTFEERLYKTDYTGSKQYEEEIDKMHYEDECTFAPTLRAGKPSGYDEANDTTGTERIDRLYKDSEDKARKAKERQEELESEEARKSQLKLATSKSKIAKSIQQDDDRSKPFHERMYSGASKMLEKKQAQISAAQKGPEKSSFMPKFFSSKKTRQSVGSRDFEAMYEDGKTKVASRPQDLDANALAEREAAALEFKPKLATAPKRRSRDAKPHEEPASPGKILLAEALNIGDDDDDEDGMNPMLRGGSANESTDSVASSASAKPARKVPAQRSQRSAALQSKAAELLAKRAAAREAAVDA